MIIAPAEAGTAALPVARLISSGAGLRRDDGY